jgi:hypothetical protein
LLIPEHQLILQEVVSQDTCCQSAEGSPVGFSAGLYQGNLRGAFWGCAFGVQSACFFDIFILRLNFWQSVSHILLLWPPSSAPLHYLGIIFDYKSKHKKQWKSTISYKKSLGSDVFLHLELYKPNKSTVLHIHNG